MKKIISRIVSTVVLFAPMTVLAASSTATITPGDLMSTAESSGLTKGKTMTDYVQILFNWIIGIVGFIAILGFLISAVMYFTAAGDEEKISKAKSAMTYSIIGVIVALVGFVVLNIVQGFLDQGTI